MSNAAQFLDANLVLTPEEVRDILQALRTSNSVAAMLQRDGVLKTLKPATRTQIDHAVGANSKALHRIDTAARRQIAAAVEQREKRERAHKSRPRIEGPATGGQPAGREVR